MRGRRAAITAFNAYAKAHYTSKPPPAEAATGGMGGGGGNGRSLQWLQMGGDELAEHMSHVDLVDARFLLNLAESTPYSDRTATRHTPQRLP